ncbi:hypothetical protein HHK36_015340 [Tetracentron sinense]|uniref:TATA box-binding protein-associated factor RNA polymerase I subunit B n=1 Tax=Tetracentron sinense TaxID=13715 RepID=A0A834Z0M9_TETSI|nr:hypothetical protein HHK36_015340 [Tetracentron sinense]
MAESLTCHACGNVGFDNCDDGFYYCLRCGSQAEDIVETGVAEEDFLDQGDGHGAIYLSGHRRRIRHSVIKTEPLSDSQFLHYQTQQYPQSQFWNSLTLTDDRFKSIKIEDQEDVKPSVPNDFGAVPNGLRRLSSEEYCSEIRIRYVMGIQLMIQFQCQSLVENFGASPLICGLAGVIWMRLVAVSGVFDDGWADKAVEDSEVQEPGNQGLLCFTVFFSYLLNTISSLIAEETKVHKPRAKYSAEPQNIHGQRAVMIWFRSLKKIIPISSSLAVSFLACHIAREAILPTDILKWSLDGKLPYLTAFVDIEKCFGRPSSACPLSSCFMFRPSKAVAVQRLESLAASVAQAIGLHLPPVNFYAIASRYLEKLTLPVEKILPHACHIYEWSMPPDLWLSTNEFRLSSRVCVMSILMVAIRILYNINGFGKWETILSSFSGSSSSYDQVEKSDLKCNSRKKNNDAHHCSPSSNLHENGTKPISPSRIQKSELDVAEILCDLEATYDKIYDSQEYSKDLPTYLKYCKDVVFAGLAPSFEANEEEKIIEQLWNFYESQESEPSKDTDTEMGCSGGGLNQKRSRDEEGCVNNLTENKKFRDESCSSIPFVDNGTFDVDDLMRWRMDGHDCSSSPQEEENSVSDGRDSAETHKDRTLKRMKSNMEENRFCYIPPRVNIKRLDYLHYVRKNDEGARTYVAHADYYILLRACARVALVDVRNMHAGVLKLERRLAWVEKRIDHCLHLGLPSVPSDFSHDMEPQQDADDSHGFQSYL